MPRLSERSAGAPAGEKASLEGPDQQVAQPARAKPVLVKQEPRLYRQDDGSLGPTRPPRNPYTVASRRAWTDIVRFARLKVAQAEKGNDGTHEAYRSYRYGEGVSFEAHALYLQQLGMEPEQNADGSWIGFDPSKQDPLRDDLRHPLNALKSVYPELTVDAAK